MLVPVRKLLNSVPPTSATLVDHPESGFGTPEPTVGLVNTSMLKAPLTGPGNTGELPLLIPRLTWLKPAGGENTKRPPVGDAIFLTPLFSDDTRGRPTGASIRRHHS